jgi:hypothetical protein
MIKIVGELTQEGYEINYKGAEEGQTYIDIQYNLEEKDKIIDALERIVEFLKTWKEKP